MCGICGIYNLNHREGIDKSRLRKMTDILSHRGPDDEGFLIDGNMGLGHKRLSIIDLSSAGHQPMANEDKTVWIVYNGEIYNHVELRKELVQKGYEFKSHSDTEVILHLYEKEGENCLQKLNGMFAFLIWDKRKRKIFAARDRLGIKPFYYYSDKKKFIFASEIKAILKYGIKAEPDFSAINDYLAFQFCLGEKTFFKGIKKIEPGHYLILKDGELRVRKYWDLDYSIDAKQSEKEFIEELSNLIKESVKIQLRSDVPLGAHLSGGIDTSIVTCLASRYFNFKVPFKTFTGFFPFGKEYDERKYAKLVSNRTRSQYFEISPKSSDFVNILPKLIYFMDEPAGGPGIFPQYFVSKLAAKNVKVVLGGQGGDEVWGGYTRYLIAYLEQALKGAILGLQEEGKYVVTLKSIVPNLGILKGYASTLQYFWQEGIFGSMDERYFRLIKRMGNMGEIFADSFLKKIQDDSSSLTDFKKLFNYPNTPSYFNRMTHFDIKTLLPALLHVEDRTSMAVSLESRVPLLDHRILELSTKIPPTMKFKGGEAKHILKAAVKDFIPKEILERKEKIGFAVPLSEWYRKKEVKTFLRAVLLSKKARERGIYKIEGVKRLLEGERKFGREIWGLLCLELWFRNFIDKKI
ncbi:MAG: asparagine synthase (glutamine-hydrolyzing) [Candidatus Pacebacteria bacterium]|nr:asparagine synthase (glutamine-hydrolyzing) [Candidatus Paceibacterota bacterium]